VSRRIRSVALSCSGDVTPPCVNLKMVDARGLPGIILGKMNIKNSATENVNITMPNLFKA
jgi:hypothetical protein